MPLLGGLLVLVLGLARVQHGREEEWGGGKVQTEHPKNAAEKYQAGYTTPYLSRVLHLVGVLHLPLLTGLHLLALLALLPGPVGVAVASADRGSVGTGRRVATCQQTHERWSVWGTQRAGTTGRKIHKTGNKHHTTENG
jgi:hypothetical protein